jgi:Domain of unknown function DUF29
MPVDTLYEEDLMLWAEQQGEELRRAAGTGSNLPIDWENLAEEIETLGRSQRSEARKLVHQIIAHLIKLAYSPARTSWFAWESEIDLFRGFLDGRLKDSPSLRPGLSAMVERETPRAVRTAVRSLRKYEEWEAAAAVERATFSFTPEQILDTDWFLPGTYERIVRQLKSDPQR